MTENGGDADEGDFDLERDFPVGDGTADLSGVVICPYCAEESEIALDPGSGNEQVYVEDCPVCCQPWNVNVAYGSDGSASVQISALE